MNSIHDLTEQISKELELVPSEKVEFLTIVEAWESSVDTMARVEPPGEHAEDLALLSVYDKQEATYEELFIQASLRVKDAFDRFLKLRTDQSNNTEN